MVGNGRDHYCWRCVCALGCRVRDDHGDVGARCNEVRIDDGGGDLFSDNRVCWCELYAKRDSDHADFDLFGDGRGDRQL